jgi:cephalosporin-C deacetylase
MAAGYTHFIMASRGQGSSWQPRRYPGRESAGLAHPGYMTRGIESAESYTTDVRL